MDAMLHDLPFVLTREGSAGFAADVMGRMTDAPVWGLQRLDRVRPISRQASAMPGSIARP